jgi:hypothetical protein
VFGACRRKTIATLWADGSRWVFGIGAAFEHGEVVFGSMVKRAGARICAGIRSSPYTAPRLTQSR